MAILEVLTIPDRRLRIKAEPVEKVDDSIRQIINDMVETMYQAEGCGLAATQVGIAKRIIVIDVSEASEEKILYKMINPEIIFHSLETCNGIEGCLSVPNQYAEVSRYKSVKVRYLDENNQTQELETDTFMATCLQHEIDHLDGKLYIDYLSPLKRQLITKKVEKLKLS